VKVRVEEEPMSRLGDHAQIPIAFLVERILAVSVLEAGLGGVLLTESEVDAPWVKDCDDIEGQCPI
jgi:hypothetical protein